VDESASDQFSSEDYIVIKNSSSGVEDFYLHRFVARMLQPMYLLLKRSGRRCAGVHSCISVRLRFS
jgi:hypothetical protein